VKLPPEPWPVDKNGNYVLGPDGRIAGCKNMVCHSFIRNGKIEYLSECTHELAGQTVDMEDV
jgi:hypothetical protein